MKGAGVLYSDKYFHCVAQCKASKYSESTAEWIGNKREVLDALFMTIAQARKIVKTHTGQNIAFLRLVGELKGLG